jgi:hypothetical protein
METSPDINEHMLRAALEYLRLGYRPIPLPPGSKGKGMRFKWKPYQGRSPTEEEILEWFAAGEPNVALVTGNGTVVVDVDDPGLVDEVLAHCGDTPQRCQTPSCGVHLWYGMRKGIHYGNAVKIRGREIDLRCEGAYACAPWSRNENGVPYRWLGPVLPAVELPLLKVSWLRERKPTCALRPVEPGDNPELLVKRARAYLARLEGAVSGCRGHDRAMRAAGILCQKFGLSLEQAFPLLKEWSQLTCEPPWSDKELVHKLKDAIRLRAQRGLRPIS